MLTEESHNNCTSQDLREILAESPFYEQNPYFHYPHTSVNKLRNGSHENSFKNMKIIVNVTLLSFADIVFFILVL